MSLTLVLGGSGEGKSAWIQQQIIDRSVQESSTHFLFLVPEQFTLQTQRELILRHPRSGLLNMEVLSFRRLAWRIFEELGEETKDVLTETGKSLILRQVAIACREELPVLGRRMNQKGYVAKVKSILSEFAQYEIGTGELEDMIALSQGRAQLPYKLRDLRTLMEAFDAFRADRFLTGEEVLGRLADVADRSELLRRSVLVLDGFTGFTPVQMRVLRALLKTSPELYACLTLGAGEAVHGEIRDHELFALTKKTIRGLTSMAAEEHVRVNAPVRPNVPHGRFVPGSGLARLERRLFREADAKREEYLEEAAAGETREDIRLLVMANPAQEAHAAAREIRRMADAGQVRYREIAVITGSLPDYEFHLRRSFEALGIPCFIDRKVSLDTNPCIDFVRSAMEAASSGLSYASMIRMLRTGFAGAAQEETDLLETYVLSRGVRGKKRWMSAWEEPCSTLTAEENAQCEMLRHSLMERFAPFLEAFSQEQADVARYVHGVELLLQHFGTQEVLERTTEVFQTQGDPARALEYSQIWQVICGLLEETERLLGKEYTSRKEFAQILDAGFEEARIGITPPGLDQVQVGDMERTRLQQVKVLFFLGMNDGWIPVSENDSSLVSEMEREFLANEGVVLAPDARELGYMQRFYLYLCLTKPSRMLWVSWSLAKTDGSALRASYVAAMLQELFPECRVRDGSFRENLPEAAVSYADALPALAAELGRAKAAQQMPKQLGELWRQYCLEPDAGRMAQQVLQAAFSAGSSVYSIGEELAGKLYGREIAGSVSRLEQFAACSYGHFLKYGLRLQEREIYEVRAADLGTIFHDALDRFFGQARAALAPGQRFADLPLVKDPALYEPLADACLEESVERLGRGVFFDSARSRFVVERMRRILKKTVWGLLYQIQKGNFEPAVFEARFDQANAGEAARIPLAGGSMELSGRIDRIDRCMDQNRIWMKVLDYKSGNTGFDLTGLIYGLQLQLPVYMNGAIAMEQKVSPGKEVLPGALFYYRMKDPVTDAAPGETDEDAQKQKVLRLLRPDGLLCSDPAVVDGLDRTFTKTSDAAPMEKRKAGGLSARSKAVSAARMGELCDYAAGMAKNLGEQLAEGDTQRLPYRRKNRTACDWCSLREACPQDGRMPDCRYRQIKEFPSEDAKWEMIGQKTNGL